MSDYILVMVYATFISFLATLCVIIPIKAIFFEKEIFELNIIDFFQIIFTITFVLIVDYSRQLLNRPKRILHLV